MQTVFIAESVLSEIIAAARESYPYETGGMAIEWRSGGLLQQIHKGIQNVHTSPEHNYAGEASQTIAAYEIADTFDGGRISFAWHSHPTAPAVPSQVDRDSISPANTLVLVSFANIDLGSEPDVKVWSISNGNATELSWVTW